MQEKNKFEQQKKEFQSTLSMFSHEIRNPLALITSELQMLSDHHPQLCLDEHWDNIMENLNYIRELLDELSRYQNAGHLSLVSTDTSLWLDRITNTFRPALDYLGIVLETDIPIRGSSPHLELDQTKIVRGSFPIFSTNAQEAIQHAHGKIRICRFCCSDGIQITVHRQWLWYDCPADGTDLFPFCNVQARRHRSRLLSRSRSSKHHGTAPRVESVPGEGTTFIFFCLSDDTEEWKSSFDQSGNVGCIVTPITGKSIIRKKCHDKNLSRRQISEPSFVADHNINHRSHNSKNCTGSAR